MCLLLLPYLSHDHRTSTSNLIWYPEWRRPILICLEGQLTTKRGEHVALLPGWVAYPSLTSPGYEPVVELISSLYFLYLCSNFVSPRARFFPVYTSHLMCSFFGIVSQWLWFVWLPDPWCALFKLLLETFCQSDSSAVLTTLWVWLANN